MTEITRQIRETSVVVDSSIPIGFTLEEYRRARPHTRSRPAARSWTDRLLRRRA